MYLYGGQSVKKQKTKNKKNHILQGFIDDC